MSHPTLPTVFEVSQTLAVLLNRSVKASLMADRGISENLVDYHVGLYDDGKSGLEAMWLSDLNLSAAFGAALTFIPKPIAEAAIKSKIFSPEMLDNLREVANVTANSFKGKRVRLVDFHKLTESRPPDVARFISGKVQILKMSVEVASFFSGTLILVVNSD